MLCAGVTSAQYRPRGGRVDAAVFKTETVQGVWVRVPPGSPQMEVAMPSMSDMKSRLDKIRREIEKLQAQEALLLDMMGEAPRSAPRAAKGSVKTAVLDLLEDAGRNGLNAASAVETAKSRSIELERGSVSSLLSRLKTDGVVSYDGTVYRLKRYTGMPSAVTPIRTSGEG